jgi:hypothetical protein
MEVGGFKVSNIPLPKQWQLDKERLIVLALKLSEQYYQKYFDKGEYSVINRQIIALDNQIDKLVYEIYGLTEEDIAVVEKNE